MSDKNQTPQIAVQSHEIKPIANKEKKEKFLEYFRQLPIQELGANFIGVHENTITAWKKEDVWFRDCIDNAKSQWALDNARRVRSKEWLLERVMSNHFKERKEVDVNLPQPILSNVSKNDGDK